MGGDLNAPQEGLADVSGSALALLARHLVVGAGHGLLHELPVAFARLKRDVEEVDATHVLEAAEILALDRTSQRAPCKAAKAKKNASPTASAETHAAASACHGGKRATTTPERRFTDALKPEKSRNVWASRARGGRRRITRNPCTFLPPSLRAAA